MPQVSIITPCYNSSNFLEETIQSVLHQNFTDWEWIITDDKSSDNSVEIIKKQQDSRIILIEAEKNGGAGHARNLALEKATGRYITFLDADDYWEPNFLSEMISFMQSEKAELAYCTYARCDENLQPKIADFEADIEVTFDNFYRIILRFIIGNNPFPVCKILMKNRLNGFF